MRAGGLVAFATETVYGLGALATDPAAVARIFAAKGRPAQNPVIVHVASIEQARGCVAQWPESAERLARRFWPGPLTLVLPRAPVIPDLVTAGRHTVAVRSPAAKVALGLIDRAETPLAAPSANRSNALSPTAAAHVLADLDGRIELVIDSGLTALGIESTVLDLSHNEPRVLRPGPISRVMIEQALGSVPVARADPLTAADAPASPGQMPVHYAPKTPAFRASALEEIEPFLEWDDVALIVFGPQDSPAAESRLSCHVIKTPEVAARSLYAALHACDSWDARMIVVLMPPDTLEWEAVRDRLLRATRPLSDIQ